MFDKNKIPITISTPAGFLQWAAWRKVPAHYCYPLKRKGFSVHILWDRSGSFAELLC
jgi:hypothetical protein